ncbi:hypothetical protein DY000_02039941 [Brassica cretica]|uniref:Uncharacterized protein n=1 Tax=Brassica cretica TaxID=69181 RepID=A0ABQ7BM64_BRACR|nr:hypothetical protein DY000_02039941 [Brassica cretica]
MCADPRIAPPDVYMDDTAPNDYDLGPIEDDADAETYRRWMIDTQQKNNSLTKKILRVIIGSCFLGQTTGATEQEHTPQPSCRAEKETAEINAAFYSLMLHIQNTRGTIRNREQLFPHLVHMRMIKGGKQNQVLIGTTSGVRPHHNMLPPPSLPQHLLMSGVGYRVGDRRKDAIFGGFPAVQQG